MKAFNTVFAQHYGTGLKVNGQPIQTFVAGDDEAARETVKALAAEIGLEPVDAGPLERPGRRPLVHPHVGVLQKREKGVGRGVPVPQDQEEGAFVVEGRFHGRRRGR